MVASKHQLEKCSQNIQKIMFTLYKNNTYINFICTTMFFSMGSGSYVPLSQRAFAVDYHKEEAPFCSKTCTQNGCMQRVNPLKARHLKSCRQVKHAWSSAPNGALLGQQQHDTETAHRSTEASRRTSPLSAVTVSSGSTDSVPQRAGSAGAAATARRQPRRGRPEGVVLPPRQAPPVQP